MFLFKLVSLTRTDSSSVLAGFAGCLLTFPVGLLCFGFGSYGPSNFSVPLPFEHLRPFAIIPTLLVIALAAACAAVFSPSPLSIASCVPFLKPLNSAHGSGWIRLPRFLFGTTLFR